MNQGTKNLLIFVSGAATGAALGILFAPDSGKNVRDKISYRLQSQWQRLKEMLNRGEGPEEYDTRGELRSEDFRKAEDLLNEVEGLLDEIKNKSVR